MAKMDLELWMQEDGTNMFGAVLYSADIYDLGTAQRAAAHILVHPHLTPGTRAYGHSVPVADCATVHSQPDTSCWTACLAFGSYEWVFLHNDNPRDPKCAS